MPRADQHWTTLPMFAELLGEPRLADEAFDTREKRSANAEQLMDVVTEALQRWEGRELFERASSAGMLTGFVQDAAQLLECPQLRARGVFHAVHGSDGPLGRWRLPATVAQLSRTPTRVRTGAPALGEHTGPIWVSPRPARQGEARPAPGWPEYDDQTPRGPLHGLRVVDLSTVVAVPLLARCCATWART